MKFKKKQKYQKLYITVLKTIFVDYDNNSRLRYIVSVKITKINKQKQKHTLILHTNFYNILTIDIFKKPQLLS